MTTEERAIARTALRCRIAADGPPVGAVIRALEVSPLRIAWTGDRELVGTATTSHLSVADAVFEALATATYYAPEASVDLPTAVDGGTELALHIPLDAIAGVDRLDVAVRITGGPLTYDTDAELARTIRLRQTVTGEAPVDSMHVGWGDAVYATVRAAARFADRARLVPPQAVGSDVWRLALRPAGTGVTIDAEISRVPQ